MGITIKLKRRIFFSFDGLATHPNRKIVLVQPYTEACIFISNNLKLYTFKLYTHIPTKCSACQMLLFNSVYTFSNYSIILSSSWSLLSLIWARTSLRKLLKVSRTISESSSKLLLTIRIRLKLPPKHNIQELVCNPIHYWKKWWHYNILKVSKNGITTTLKKRQLFRKFLVRYITEFINSQKFRRDKFSDFFLSDYLSTEILPNPKIFPSEIFGF